MMENRNHHRNGVVPPQAEPDYESDFLQGPPPPAARSNEQVNLSVLRRYNPLIASIICVAPYAVLYCFSPSSRQWEKKGIEGSLFVCQLEPESNGAERYTVFILNRRSLENFSHELLSDEDVDITEEYIILKALGETNPEIYGLWIFSEPEPNSTAHLRAELAKVILDCAASASTSRKIAEQQQWETEAQQNGEGRAEKEGEQAQSQEQVPASVDMGRQVSLRDLFGQQREQDSAWSIHNHHSPHAETQEQDPPKSQFVTHPDTDFFRGAPRFTPQQETANRSAPPEPTGSISLDDLFSNAREPKSNS